MTSPAVGWCARAEDADRVKAIGYDFIELPLGPLNLEDDECFRKATANIDAASLATPVFNQFLPKGLAIVGPEVNAARIQHYLARVAEFTHAAGAELIVFGSGWARVIPEGFDRDTAVDQFEEMVSWCMDALSGTGITLAIESQNRKETNFITTLAEAVALATRINHPQVRVITDTYHLHEESESLEVVRQSARWIAHAHVSDSARHTPGRGVYDFDAFFRCLNSVGYQGRLSVECMTGIPEPEMRRSLEFVRRGWAGRCETTT